MAAMQGMPGMPGAGAGGMPDFAQMGAAMEQVMQNPQMRQMAENLMQNPEMQNMMQNMMGGGGMPGMGGMPGAEAGGMPGGMPGMEGFNPGKKIYNRPNLSEDAKYFLTFYPSGYAGWYANGPTNDAVQP